MRKFLKWLAWFGWALAAIGAAVYIVLIRKGEVEADVVSAKIEKKAQEGMEKTRQALAKEKPADAIAYVDSEYGADVRGVIESGQGRVGAILDRFHRRGVARARRTDTGRDGANSGGGGQGSDGPSTD